MFGVPCLRSSVHVLLGAVLLACISAKGFGPLCPYMRGVHLLRDAANPCVFYVCMSGSLLDSPHLCPSDPDYYKTLEKSGINNPCQWCPLVKAHVPPTTSVRPSTSTANSPTTSTMSTTAAASTQPTPQKEITAITPGAHLRRGYFGGANITLRTCLGLCEDDVACVGFDYDVTHDSCWMHTYKSECSGVRAKENCTHFSLYPYCYPGAHVLPTQTTTSTTTTTTPWVGDQVGGGTGQAGGGTTPGGQTTTTSATTTTAAGTTSQLFILTFRGYHASGARYLPLSTKMATAYNCVKLCRMDATCRAADFDRRTRTCWLHDDVTACGHLLLKDTCTHYRLTNFCPDTNPTGMTQPTLKSSSPLPSFHFTNPTRTTTTRRTTTTTTSTASPPTSGAPPTASDLLGGGKEDGVPEGFHSVRRGVHVQGGRRVFVALTVGQCAQACLSVASCMAVDYNHRERTCYMHFWDTYCRSEVALDQSVHFKRLPCLDGASVTAVTEVWTSYHVLGGSQVCRGYSCTLRACIRYCFLDFDCAGVDYDVRDSSCHMLSNAARACAPLTPKRYCTHVTKLQCITGVKTPQLPDVGAIGADPVSRGGGATVRFAPPTGGVVGWVQYPGARISGGRSLAAGGMTGDLCLAACVRDVTCHSVDFDSQIGSCWGHHERTSQCVNPMPMEYGYHFRRDVCGD